MVEHITKLCRGLIRRSVIGKQRTREDLNRRYDKYLSIKTRFGDRLRVICVPRDMVEDTINCSGDGLESRLIAKDILHKIKSWLPETDYTIIYLYYYKRYNMKQIGALLDVSEGWVSQVHSRTINNIKSRYR